MILRDAIGNNVRSGRNKELKSVTDVIQRRKQRMTNSIFFSLSLSLYYFLAFLFSRST